MVAISQISVSQQSGLAAVPETISNFTSTIVGISKSPAGLDKEKNLGAHHLAFRAHVPKHKQHQSNADLAKLSEREKKYKLKKSEKILKLVLVIIVRMSNKIMNVYKFWERKEPIKIDICKLIKTIAITLRNDNRIDLQYQHRVLLP